MNVENSSKNSDLTSAKLLDWLIDYIFLVGILSALLALIATFLIYANPNNNISLYFPSIAPYIKEWFVYGWGTTLLMIALVQAHKHYRLLLLGLKAIIVAVLNITKLNTKLNFNRFKKFGGYSKKFNFKKGEKELIKLTTDKKPVKSMYALKVPIDVLPVNKLKKKERSFSNDKYEAMVKTAFTRVGAMNEEQLSDVKVYDVKEGPRAIQINISLPNGMTVSSLKNKTEDLRHAFDAPSFQIEAGRAGRANLTIFLKENTRIVLLRDILERDDIQCFIKDAILPIIVGVDPIGEPLLYDLVDAPHLLVAGATKSGKTWWLIQVLYLLFMKLSPEELEVWIVDPKFVDFAKFNEVPHVKRVETEVPAAVNLLQQAVKLMDDRYRMMKKHTCRNIEQYNAKFPNKDKRMKYIVIPIDEIADLILQNKDDVSQAIARLAQKGRAAGIHLINATQRPSVKIIDGDIKANLPSRISFKLKTKTDYTTILGYGIETELQGFGDGIADLEGLFGYSRFQSPGVGLNDTEIDSAINRLVEYWNVKVDQVQDYNKNQENKNMLVKLNKDHAKDIDTESNTNEEDREDEIVFFHGKNKEYKKAVPFSNSKGGTSIVESNIDNEYEEELDQEDSNKYGEADIDSYHRLLILKKIKNELIKSKDDEDEIVYAPSSNALSAEIGIRKSTILEHLGDLLKEGVVEQHPTNKRYIIRVDKDELDQMIDDIDKALTFINNR